MTQQEKIEAIRQKPHGNTKHGYAGRGKQTKTYMIWGGMIARCTNPKDKSYPRYGGRGIDVCARWRTFENFLADMGEKPEGMSIERIDNSRGYFPENCRWIPLAEQSRNRRNVRLLTFNGKTRNLTEWSKEVGIDRETLLSRIKKGWDAEKVLTTKRYGR